MKILFTIITLLVSFNSYALSNIEKDCLFKSVYYEARNREPEEWLTLAGIGYTRKKLYPKYHFKSKSSHMCDIVKSGEYSSNFLLKKPIKEPNKYKEIVAYLSKHDYTKYTSYVSFKHVNGKLILKGIG